MSLTEFAAHSGTPVHSQDDAPADTFTALELSAIVVSLTNPRTTFNEAKLAELAESIKASGVHQPILVRPLPPARLQDTFGDRREGKPLPTYEIVAGERRYRASWLAGVATIPALVRRLTDAQVLEIQIVENLQREDLSELEEAEGYQRLVESTSIAKEAIGDKIGKSRSYVYQRLKLLDLDTAAREALRTGQIDASKALLIARIPDAKLQIKALGMATGSANYGNALSVKDLQTWLQANVMLALKRARFNIKDVTLRPEAGACPACPKRTGANPDLFADVESADICTDPRCYHDKEKTHDDRRFEQAQRDGKKTIDADKAGKLFDQHSRQWLKGHQLLDEYPDYRLGINGATLRKALGKHCPAPVMVVHPETGVLTEVLPTDRVKQIIKEQGLSRDAKHDEAKQEIKPIEQRREYRIRWQEAVLARTDAHLKTIDPVIPPELLRAWLLDQLEGYCEGAFGPALDLGNEFDTGVAHDRILTLPAEELPRLVMRFMLHNSEDTHDAWDAEREQRQAPRTALFELVHMAGVDVPAVRAEIKRAMESEERAAELEAEAKAADKAAPKLKKSTASPAAPTTAARGKPIKGQAPDGADKEESAAPAAQGLSPMAAWPFPINPASSWPKPIAQPAAPVLRIGAAVKIKAEGLSPSRAGYAGKTGKVCAKLGDTAWDVTVDKPGRFPKQAVFDASELEVVA